MLHECPGQEPRGPHGAEAPAGLSPVDGSPENCPMLPPALPPVSHKPLPSDAHPKCFIEITLVFVANDLHAAKSMAIRQPSLT